MTVINPYCTSFLSFSLESMKSIWSKDEVWKEYMHPERRWHQVCVHKRSYQGFSPPKSEQTPQLLLWKGGLGGMWWLWPRKERVFLRQALWGVCLYYALCPIWKAQVCPADVRAFLLQRDDLLGVGELAFGVLLPEKTGGKDVRHIHVRFRGGHQGRGGVQKWGGSGHQACPGDRERAVAGEDEEDFWGACFFSRCADPGISVSDFCHYVYGHPLCEHSAGLGYSKKQYGGRTQVYAWVQLCGLWYTHKFIQNEVHLSQDSSVLWACPPSIASSIYNLRNMHTCDLRCILRVPFRIFSPLKMKATLTWKLSWNLNKCVDRKFDRMNLDF